jgi:hypothetical protein
MMYQLQKISLPHGLRLSIGLALILVAPLGASAQGAYFTGTTRTAASCSYSDVSAQVASSADRDVVIIPAGNCTWSTRLVIQRGITLTGSGALATVITDGVAKSGGTSQLISVTTNEPAQVRITNIWFKGGATGDPYNVGHIAIHGTTKAFRVDNFKVTSPRSAFVRVFGHAYGVVDSCQFEALGSSSQILSVTPGGWGGSAYGDGSWAERLYLGTEKAVYLESCNLTTTTTAYANMAQLVDVLDGGRVVVRFNTISGGMVSSHGTESGQRRRGMRSFEHYHNTMTPGPAQVGDAQFYLRGGTGVVFGNTASGSWNHRANFLNFRDSGPYTPWGQCNGSSGYDGNVIGGYPCVDQIGRGTSKHLNGAATPPAQWVGNGSDPAYAWNNTGGTYSFSQYANSKNIANNRDFYHDQSASCTAGGACTSGVGSGTSLPTSCTAGVAFWKTNDGGNWNTTNDVSNDGRLYKCTAPNTWTAWYTPYIYPHPLRTGGTSSVETPGTPKNVRIVGS